MRPRTSSSTPTARSGPASIDGRIVRISPDGGEPVVVADTGGRPLGLHVARDGRLLVCDSPRGLLAMDPAPARSRRWSTRSTAGLCSSARMSPKLPDGTIYFTESTSAFTYEHFLGADPRGPRARQSVPSRSRRHGAHRGRRVCTSPTASRRPPTGRRWCSPRRRAAGCPSTGSRGAKAGTVTPLAVNLPGMPGQPVHRRRRPDLVRDGDAGQRRGRAAARRAPPLHPQGALATARAASPEARSRGVGGGVRPRQRRRRRRPTHRAPSVRHGHRVWSKPAASCGWVASVARPSRTSTCATVALTERLASAVRRAYPLASHI